MNDELVEIDAIMVAKTARAVLIKLDEDSEEVWLPLSLIDVRSKNLKGDYFVEVSLPEWLAEREGLI